ncbi:hypothetical protein [Mycolicibacterium mageritense]|uniref:hypothetical protein n=1 Tax=Mycolicibacterium mageritense TaxID=53462 RepID=UPI0011DB4C95|nr:hypothetical protein [Mycolicibacterium mageritense]TXI56460.1 MAG: hypothetical protein E6Q55_28760 [Mycolicibacterium mageritense]
MPLTFTPEAADRLTTLAASSNGYEQAVLAAVKPVLSHLNRHPELHRVSASQFNTTPTTWGRIIDVDDGASWTILWTRTDQGVIRILRIEPAPSLS